VEVPTGVQTLTDLIKFNIDNADRELLAPYYDDQSRWAPSRFLLSTSHILTIVIRFKAADISSMDDTYFTALRFNKDICRAKGIDATLKKFAVDALLIPTDSPC
jgi:amidase